MSKALGGLAKSDKAARARLGAAKTPTAQASATSSLAAAYTAAAKPLAKLDVNPADRAAHAQLVRALNTTAAAYRKAASAASRNNKAGFRSAGGAVSAARSSVSRALAGLKAAGYDVSS